jgi:hypothetical protein
LNRSTGSDITFQFFGAKNDGTKIRDILNRMVERGKLGNYTLVPNFLLFKQEPGLMLQVCIFYFDLLHIGVVVFFGKQIIMGKKKFFVFLYEKH